MGHYLPEDFIIPESFTNLHFFAQINLSKVPVMSDFPAKGLLLFFLKDYKRSWDDGAVLYIPEVPADISVFKYVETFASATKSEYSITIGHAVKESNPYPRDHVFYEIFEELSADLDDEVKELVEEKFSEMAGENAGHRMGGYAFFTQDDPRYNEKYKEYIQLMQIDELESREDMMFWGDSGAGHFFIHPDDLKKRDFSNILFHWDCY